MPQEQINKAQSLLDEATEIYVDEGNRRVASRLRGIKDELGTVLRKTGRQEDRPQKRNKTALKPEDNY